MNHPTISLLDSDLTMFARLGISAGGQVVDFVTLPQTPQHFECADQAASIRRMQECGAQPQDLHSESVMDAGGGERLPPDPGTTSRNDELSDESTRPRAPVRFRAREKRDR